MKQISYKRFDRAPDGWRVEQRVPEWIETFNIRQINI